MIKIDFHIHSLKTKSDANFIFSIETVYKEIHEKLSSLIKNKSNIISEINSKYENALKKYSQ